MNKKVTNKLNVVGAYMRVTQKFLKSQPGKLLLGPLDLDMTTKGSLDLLGTLETRINAALISNHTSTP